MVLRTDSIGPGAKWVSLNMVLSDVDPTCQIRALFLDYSILDFVDLQRAVIITQILSATMTWSQCMDVVGSSYVYKIITVCKTLFLLPP